MTADVIQMRRCAADLDADLPDGAQAALGTLTRAAEVASDPTLAATFLATAGAVRSTFDPAVAANDWERMRWTPVERWMLRLADEVLAGMR